MRRYPALASLITAALALSPIGAPANGFDPFSTQENVPAVLSKKMIPFDGILDPCRFSAIEGPLDLLEAVERALCHNPDTRQAWANVKAQAAQLGIADSAYLPTINVSASQTRGEKRTSYKGIPELGTELHTTTTDHRMTASWTLFDFGLRGATRENARELLAAANATHDSALQTVFMAAAQAWYDLKSAQAAYDASQEAEKFAHQSYLAADAKYKAGAGALADKLQAQTRYAQARSNRVKADGDLKSAYGTLAIAMGLSANTPFSLEPGDAALPDAGFFQSIDALIEEAKLRHPALAAAQAQLRAAQASVDIAKAQSLPSVVLTGNIDRNKQVGLVPVDTFTQERNLGIQLNIPLFEGFARSYRIKAAQAQVESKQSDLARQEQQISLDVWTSYQALLTATEDLGATDDLLKSATQSFNVDQGRYKAGVGSMLELLNAQSALASAQQQRIQALSKWRTTRLKLATSLGKLGLWAITEKASEF